MLVQTITGDTVSLVESRGGKLIDRTGGVWFRYPEADTEDSAGFKCNKNIMRLHRKQLVRICKGNANIQALMTVEEIKEYIEDMEDELRDIGRSISAEDITTMVALAAGSKTILGAKSLVDSRVGAMYKKMQAEAASLLSVAPEVEERTMIPPVLRSRPVAIPVAVKNGMVLMTPRQIDFIENLDRMAGWTGVEGSYTCGEYIAAVGFQNSPSSVGAVLATLKEKGIVRVDQNTVGGSACKMFTLTEVGRQAFRTIKLKGESQ